MAAKKRKIINKRQLAVAEIWERDPTQTQEQIIAILQSEFGTKASQPTVSRDIKALDQRNLAKSDAIVTVVKQQLTGEYEFIYSEAIAAWYKSLGDKQTTIAESIEAAKGSVANRIKAIERIEGQSGNPALLAQAQNALKSIRELYGLDAPARHEVGGIKGQPILFGEAVVELPKTEYEVVSANGHNDR